MVNLVKFTREHLIIRGTYAELASITFQYLFKTTLVNHHMTQVLRPLEVGILSIIMLIGIIALTTELTEYEEIAKIIVIPSMVLLIIVTGYAVFKTAYSSK
jgi:hypothetical protein